MASKIEILFFTLNPNIYKPSEIPEEPLEVKKDCNEENVF